MILVKDLIKLLTLICIPYAGGSAVIYYKWMKYLPPYVDLVPLELSGRGERLNEPLYENFNQMCDDLYTKLLPKVQHNDYVLFGHSMGNTLAYELSQRIIREQNKLPLHAIFSGRLSPDYCNKTENFKLTDMDSFKSWIKKMGGPTDILFDNSEYSKHFLPALMSDYLALESYEFNAAYSALPFDISVLYGTEDLTTNRVDLMNWKKFTKKEVVFFEIYGDHFFINSNSETFFDVLNGILAVCRKKEGG